MILKVKKAIVEEAWEDRKMLDDEATCNHIREIIEMLDKGSVRAAEPSENGWIVNEWIKKAVILYFLVQQMEVVKFDFIYNYENRI